jgi:hypothetical protein
MGLRLVRYSQPLGYEQYGPYGLVDRTTGRIAAVRLGPEDIERLLFEEHAAVALLRGQLQSAEKDDI